MFHRVIEIQQLTCRFGVNLALDNLSLQVPPGGVFGLVGQNGAGKTTLIKHILGLLSPQTGSVRVFGLEPIAHCVQVLGRIGYLSEERDLPGWMKLGELLRYTAAFYPKWDAAYAEELRKQLGLNLGAKIGSLSLGQRAKAALLIAQAHRPELLVLDEPSSGLDPVVRRDILEAVMRAVAHEGRTVFFSSHLLDEIERVSNQVAMINCGRVVFSGDLNQIKKQHYRWRLRFDEPLTNPPAIPAALSVTGAGRDWVVVAPGQARVTIESADGFRRRVVEEGPPTLDEIFVAMVGAQPCPPQER